MPPRTFVRTPSPTQGHGRGAGIPNDDLDTRRYAGDFSHLTPILREDYNKDLPRIPSTSTGLLGDEVLTIITEMMGSPAASPIVGCPPLPVPSYHASEQAPITEAQQIAAQYRQRLYSSSDAPESTVVTDSPIRRALAEETEIFSTFREDADPFSRVHQDGTVSCTRGDCLAILPNSRAFSRHSYIHLIHEELTGCELCGISFVDDDDKDGHLGSCPKLRTSHKIASFGGEPSGSLHKFLSLFHL